MNTRIKYQSLEIVAFTAGATVMIFELIGSRILAPYFGTSIFVWTSIIGIILGSLSLGYFWGGKISDKSPSYKPLILILLIAAISLSLTTITKSSLLDLVSYFIPNMAYGSVVATIILFAPTSVFLGMVSPYTVRLKMTQINCSGRTVGNLYALSTFGSIVGTFLAGFVLIPNFGVNEILVMLIATLLIITLLLLPNTNIRLLKKHLAVIFIFLGLLITINIMNPDRFIQTAYSSVEIREGFYPPNNEPIKILYTDKKWLQGAIYQNVSPKEKMVFKYLYFFDLFKHFAPQSQEFLMIGAGVYAYPQYLTAQNPNYHLDVVEIDPKITAISKQHFGFEKNSQISIFHEDGRTFMNQNQKVYDTVFIDVFNSHASIPFHLTTKEFAKTIENSLSADGVVVINTIGSAEGKNTEFVLSLTKTYQKIFPFVGLYLVHYPDKPNKPQNIALVATKQTPNVSLNSSPDEYLHNMLQNYFAVTTENLTPYKILTDNFAPVEMMTAAQALQ
jgi:spermidine synthase